MNRIQKVKELIKEKEVHGILISSPENRRYFSGFTGSAGNLLITPDKNLLVTDFRYISQGKEQAEGYEIIKTSKEYSLTNVIKNEKLESIAIEEDYTTYEQYLKYTEKLPDIDIKSLDKNLLKIRSIKEEDEISKIRNAAQITDKAYSYILNEIKPGIKERDVANALEFFMKNEGAAKVSFDIIVASGVRSSLPHGIASEKVIEKGDMITLDFGCVYEGYCSDMTRSFVLGKATERQKEIYHVVLKAQMEALNSVKDGITGIELDNIARDIITDAGYGDYFGHGLGHGVGLLVHELPHVNHLGQEKMEPGNVITIEPGVYIPEYGGVRIEDLVVVRKDGYEVLSNSPKDLIEISC